MLDFSTLGRRVASQAASNTLQKVAGNVKGLITGNGPGIKDTMLAERLDPTPDVKTYQFPLDVMANGGMGNFGHYIMFYINEMDNATLRFGGEQAKSGDMHMRKELENRGLVDFASPMKINPITGKSERKKRQKLDRLPSC